MKLPRNFCTASTETSCQRLAKAAQTKQRHFLSRKCQPIWPGKAISETVSLVVYVEFHPFLGRCSLGPLGLARCCGDTAGRAQQEHQDHSDLKYRWWFFLLSWRNLAYLVQEHIQQREVEIELEGSDKMKLYTFLGPENTARYCSRSKC